MSESQTARRRKQLVDRRLRMVQFIGGPGAPGPSPEYGGMTQSVNPQGMQSAALCSQFFCFFEGEVSDSF